MDRQLTKGTLDVVRSSLTRNRDDNDPATATNWLSSLQTHFDLIAIAPGAKILLCLAMVLGRLELLAIIVMLNPEIWRD